MFDLVNLALTTLVSFLVLSLGWLALKNDKRNLTNDFFFLFALCLALWELFSFLENWSYGGYQMMALALEFDFFLAPFGILFASLFALSFSMSEKAIKRLTMFLAPPVLLVSSLSLTDAIIRGVSLNNGVSFGFGPLFWLYALILSGYALSSLFVLIRKYPQASVLTKKKMRYIIFGFSFSSTAILFLNLFLQNHLPEHWFRILNLFLPLAWIVSMFQAIVLYKLMNARIIMRRSIVYFLLIISILIPAGIWLYFLQLLIPNQMIWGSLIILALSMATVSGLKREYYRLANKYFFSSLYDVRELIYTVNKALHSSLDTRQVCSSVADILIDAFHPKAIASFSYDPETEKWKIIHNHHFSLKTERLSFLDYPTLTALFRKSRPLTIEVLEQKLTAADNPLVQSLKKLKVEIVVPIKIKNRLNGIIIIGAKESRDAYVINDLKVLTTVGTEISLAMENIRLYEKERRFNSKLRAEISKATRQVQVQNEELQRLDAAKDEFVSIVSHQLRTPLTGIRWFTSLLLSNKKKNLDARQLDFLNQINTSNRKMIKLVNELLDVSHIETGYKFKIVKKSFALLPLVQEVLKENVLMIKLKGLKIANHAPDGMEISADRDKIKQVWQNLLSNASTYTPRGGKISITAKTEDGRQVFTIKDNGIGIPKKQQTRLFEKFFRAKNSVLQDPNGTGLGLYIAKGIIEKHGGEIWFKSAENKGTTFSFSLPKDDLKNKKIIHKKIINKK